MITHNQCLTQEQILVPLRQLYICDFEHRKIIADYANNFKVKGFFFRKEIDFFQERLAINKIDFDVNSLPSKLLTVELVPSTCWFSNVRENVSRKTWDFLRKSTYKKANHKCEICGGRGDKWPVECHEIWDYDDTNQIQKLSNLTALCPDCHRVKHIGLAEIQGLGEQAEAHLAKINNWNTEQKDDYLETVWDIWGKRSSHHWNLDLAFLNQFEIQFNNSNA